MGWDTSEGQDGGGEDCDPEAATQRDPRGEDWEAEVAALIAELVEAQS